jgi:hypothetical protein
MATAELDRPLDEWAIAWSSNDNDEPERVLALFADDGVYEDVTLGAGVRGTENLSVMYLYLGAHISSQSTLFGKALSRSVGVAKQ